MERLALFDRIRAAPVLHRLPLGALDRLVSRSQVRRYRPGTVLAEEGRPGSELFVLLAGRVSIRMRLSPSDEQRTIAVRDAGDWVGEMALLDDAPRSASIVAEAPVRALCISRNEFLDLVGRHVGASLDLLRTVTARLRESDAAHIAALCEKNQRLSDSNHQLSRENRHLKHELDDRFGFDAFLGSSRAAQRVRATACHAADTELPVLLLGETGTGKELIARAIHAASGRCRGRFVPINCGLLSETLLESELFGHARGAFTGAADAKEGLVESADGGTLFLDEIGEMSRALQASLLRFLELGEFRRLGETKIRHARARVVAATHVDLDAALERGEFRRDLLYRLDVVRIELPPLRERIEDVPELVAHALRRTAERLGVPRLELEPETYEALCAYAYPGNVRELFNEIERIHALYPGGGRVPPQALSPRLRGRDWATPRDYRDLLRAFKIQVLERALEESGGNRSRAAQRLGIQRSNLVRMMRELGLRDRISRERLAASRAPRRGPAYAAPGRDR